MRILIFVLLAACGRDSSPAPQPPPVQPKPKPAEPADPNCTSKPNGWCPAPAGDPCGEHHDVASCKADARCGGIAYTGESFVACKFDDRGFGTNCPTVGCISVAK